MNTAHTPHTVHASPAARAAPAPCASVAPHHHQLPVRMACVGIVSFINFGRVGSIDFPNLAGCSFRRRAAAGDSPGALPSLTEPSTSAADGMCQRCQHHQLPRSPNAVSDSPQGARTAPRSGSPRFARSRQLPAPMACVNDVKFINFHRRQTPPPTPQRGRAATRSALPSLRPGTVDFHRRWHVSMMSASSTSGRLRPPGRAPPSGGSARLPRRPVQRR